MAKKRHSSHKRRRVSSPRRRKSSKRRMGAATNLYAMNGRRRKGHRRRRMGASGGTASVGAALTELAGLAIGGFIGDVAFTMGGDLMKNNGINPFLVAGTKLVGGTGIFVLGKSYAGNNSFVKGLGLGGVVSSAREALRDSAIIPSFSGPADSLYVVLPQEQQTDKGGAGMRLNAEKATIGAEKATIGTVYDAVPMGDSQGEYNFDI